MDDLERQLKLNEYKDERRDAHERLRWIIKNRTPDKKAEAMELAGRIDLLNAAIEQLQNPTDKLKN
jgi:polyhydroxyalkanoate synthesis regulator phasin